MRRGTAACLIALAILTAVPAGAIPPRNLGFESGSMSPGWSGIGRVLDAYPPRVPAAPNGKYFLVVEGGCFMQQVHQRLTLRQDRVVSGLAAFQSNDFTFFGLFNDYATITVTPPGGVPLILYSRSVKSVGGGFHDFSPFERWSYTVPADGLYTLTYTAVNVTDCFFGSDLFGDAITTLTACDPLLPGGLLRCRVTDAVTGQPMSGEIVHFSWTGPAPGQATATTGQDGFATDSNQDDWRAALLATGYGGEFYGSIYGNGSTGSAGLA